MQPVANPGGQNPAEQNPAGQNPAGQNPEQPVVQNPAGQNPEQPVVQNPAGQNPEQPVVQNPIGQNWQLRKARIQFLLSVVTLAIAIIFIIALSVPHGILWNIYKREVNLTVTTSSHADTL